MTKKEEGPQHIDTGGGAYVGGKVEIEGGDFVGRDKIVHGDEVYVQAGLSPSEALQDEAAYYYSLGVKYLEQRSYEQAINSLRAALEKAPATADLYYRLALAMSGRKRPRLWALSTVRAIEKHLRAAAELDSSCGHVYLLWALIKYDYYKLNGMFDRPPTVQQLLAQARSVDKEHLRELLSHTCLPGNEIWERLHS